jgi:putative transposase
MTVGCWVGNVDITLQRNRCVPFNRPIPDGFVVKQVQVLSKVRGTQWYVVVTIESSVSVPDAL